MMIPCTFVWTGILLEDKESKESSKPKDEPEESCLLALARTLWLLMLFASPVGVILSYIGIIWLSVFSNTCGLSTIIGLAGALLTYIMWGSLVIFFVLIQLGTCYYKWKNYKSTS